MVLTAFPHHPAGTIFEGYRGRGLLRESIDGIRVTRSYVYATANKGFTKRTLSYISFMCSAILVNPFLRSSPQVIVATSPQFLVGVAGYIISRLRRIPFVFEGSRPLAGVDRCRWGLEKPSNYSYFDKN